MCWIETPQKYPGLYSIVSARSHNEMYTTALQMWHVQNFGVIASPPASRLFTEPFIQAHMNENIKAPRH